ncbi:MAG: DUF452 family protein, partial [Bacteroidales bacterium]|nr:DUF452 family protein [Bacteroidales bacterium]
KSLHDELRWLYNRIMEHMEPKLHWDYAVTSEIDRIFPAANTKNYWAKQKGTRHIILPVSHYFFNDWNSFPEFISFVEKYRNKKPGSRETQKLTIDL